MATAFRMILEGSQQVGPVVTDASGLGTAVFDAEATTLTYEINVLGLDWGAFIGAAAETADPLDDVIDAHFHSGERGVNGPVVLGWKNGDADDFAVSDLLPDGSRTVTGVWELTDAAGTPLSSFAEELAAAALGIEVGLYANIHTMANGGGEIRGQLVVIATDNSETVNGTAGNDILPALAGNDTIAGLGGDDRIDGGAGTDTAMFSNIGARAEYDLRTYRNADNVLETRVAHVGGGADDGVDTLVNVETLQFYLDTVHLRGAQLNRMSNPDGDRFDDVLFQNSADGSGQVIFAKMVNGVLQGFDAITSPLGNDFKAIATGNVNPADPSGAAETFIQNTTDGSIIYASLDTGTTTWGVVSQSLTVDWVLRAVADVTMDASVDAIVQNAVTGQLIYADMRDGTFQEWGVVSDGLTAAFVAVGAGDINRDGTADVVVQDTATGDIFYASMIAGTFGDWFSVSTALTSEWKVVGVADLNRDGFADVIVQNLVGGDGVNPGTTLFADMAGGEFNDWRVVTTALTGDWRAGGTADVDNDGFNDVLFQNATDGSTVYADMGLAGFQSFKPVATNITNEFVLV